MYECADGVVVTVLCKMTRSEIDWYEEPVPRSCICYSRHSAHYWPRPKSIVSGLEFDREMTEITRGPEASGTLTFPRTVKTVSEEAFVDTPCLKSVVLNEGLETLGPSAF